MTTKEIIIVAEEIADIPWEDERIICLKFAIRICKVLNTRFDEGRFIDKYESILHTKKHYKEGEK